MIPGGISVGGGLGIGEIRPGYWLRTMPSIPVTVEDSSRPSPAQITIKYQNTPHKTTLN